MPKAVQLLIPLYRERVSLTSLSQMLSRAYKSHSHVGSSFVARALLLRPLGVEALLVMPAVWSKGQTQGFLRGLLWERWEQRLLKRRRAPGSLGEWRPGDYVLLDIAEDGTVGRRVPLGQRQLALVKTYRYMWADQRQSDGQKFKRWFDYIVLRRARRRHRRPGWRLAHGTWNLFMRCAGYRRFEWRLEFGRRHWCLGLQHLFH